jgi:hypothetical protein
MHTASIDFSNGALDRDERLARHPESASMLTTLVVKPVERKLDTAGFGAGLYWKRLDIGALDMNQDAVRNWVDALRCLVNCRAVRTGRGRVRNLSIRWDPGRYIETSLSPCLEFDLCTIFAEFVSLRDGHDPLQLCEFLDYLLESVPSVKGSFAIGESVTDDTESMGGGLETFTNCTPVRIVVLGALYEVYEYVLRDVPGTRSIISKDFGAQHLTRLIASTAASSDYKTGLGLVRLFELLEISPNLPAIPANIASWHNAILIVLISGQFNYLHWALPFFVTCLLRGGDPRFYICVEESAPGEKYVPVSLFYGKERRHRRISRTRGYQHRILWTRPLERFLSQHGRDISVRCLIGI